MDTAVPIACSLDADELRLRLTDMSAIGRAALRGVKTSPGQAVLRFASDAPIRERLASIVAAESHCCAFLSFTVVDDADQIVMTISGPVGADVVLDELVGAFSREAAA